VSRLLCAAAPFVLLASSCSVPLADELSAFGARCETSSDCAGSAVCYPLPTGNACVATQADLSGLLLEVRPVQGSSYGAGTSHLFDLDAEGVGLTGTRGAGLVVPFDVSLQSLVAVSPGHVYVAAGFDPPPCRGDDASVAAEVQFRPVAPYVGLNLSTVTATTPPFVAGTPSFAFDAALAPGRYDVYVRPLATAGETGCVAPPPLFLTGRAIEGDAGAFIEMPAPSRLTGQLLTPPGTSVLGSTLDLVEPQNGLLVSRPFRFETDGDPTDPPGGSFLSHAFALDYYWTDPAASPIIRLTPPEGAVAPRVYWDLSAVAIFGDKDVLLELADLDTTAVHIEASVLDEHQVPVFATVTIESKGLTGEAGFNAAYSVTTETGAEGQFVVDLLPGKYRVLARPKVDSGKALAVVPWEIDKDDLCCGKVVTVADKARLDGVARTPGGQPMSGATVVAEPPLPAPVGFLDQALGVAPVLADKASTFTDGSGAFSVGVDPDSGASDVAVDFSLRPVFSSGLPWLVRPRVLVHKTGTDLGALTMTYPAVLAGTVRDPSGAPVPGAVLRAWLPLEATGVKSGVATGTVTQVAEVEADAFGDFILPLPPSTVQTAPD
jgi:hypothetical protein